MSLEDYNDVFFVQIFEGERTKPHGAADQLLKLVHAGAAGGIATASVEQRRKIQGGSARTLSADASVTVVRDGVQKAIPASELVFGDRVVLQEGDKIPADVILVAGSLSADESCVTGESDEIAHTVHTLLLGGSAVASGNGVAVVLNCGENSMLGRMQLGGDDDPEAGGGELHPADCAFAQALMTEVGLISRGLGVERTEDCIVAQLRGPNTRLARVLISPNVLLTADGGKGFAAENAAAIAALREHHGIEVVVVSMRPTADTVELAAAGFAVGEGAVAKVADLNLDSRNEAEFESAAAAARVGGVRVVTGCSPADMLDLGAFYFTCGLIPAVIFDTSAGAPLLQSAAPISFAPPGASDVANAAAGFIMPSKATAPLSQFLAFCNLLQKVAL